jgi:hypothetical protein
MIHQDRLTAADGIEAWTFTECVLKLVYAPTELATRPERSFGDAVEDDRNGRSIDVKQLDAGLAEPIGGVDGNPGTLHDRPEVAS